MPVCGAWKKPWPLLPVEASKQDKKVMIQLRRWAHERPEWSIAGLAEAELAMVIEPHP